MKRIYILLLLISFYLVSCKKAETADACQKVSCQNGATCNDGKCGCTSGYFGSNCQLEDRADFSGSYSATDQCYNYNHSYNGTIENLGSDPTRIKVNLQFRNVTYPVLCILSSETYGNIPQQTVNNAVVSGTLSFDRGTKILTVYYNYDSLSMISDDCYKCTWIKM